MCYWLLFISAFGLNRAISIVTNEIKLVMIKKITKGNENNEDE